MQAVSKKYCIAQNEFYALKHIYFKLYTREMVAIMGASGSGKSTFMNIMGFLDTCTEGKYFFAGQDVSNLAPDDLAAIRNQQIGFVFQSFFLLPRCSALENVMLPLFYRGIKLAQAQALSLVALAKVGMDAWHNHKPNQLSGGQQQRVAIARALVGDPSVILADEPTGALDSQTGDDVLQLLKHLNVHENKTIVIITHDQALSQHCQRVVHLKDGCQVT